MEFLSYKPRPSTRLNRGNLVLANAENIDVRPVRSALNVFTDIHRRFIEAHVKVAHAKALERQEIARVADLDGAVNIALTQLSAALLLSGASRRNPFNGYAELGPGKMVLLSFARKATATHNLVAALRRSMGVSNAVLQAADQAEEAAIKVEEALPGCNLRRTYLAMMRQQRDALIPQWDAAYRALSLLSRSLSVIEIPTLHATLFAPLRRSPKPTIDSPAADAAELPSSEAESAASSIAIVPSEALPSQPGRVIPFNPRRAASASPGSGTP